MKKKITKALIKKREKRTKNGNERRLWKLLRQNIIDRQDNKCYLCEKEFSTSKMDIHHIIDRRVRSLMFEPLNVVGLCKRCHRLSFLAVHQTAIYFSEKLRVKEPERYYFLLKKIDEIKESKEIKVMGKNVINLEEGDQISVKSQNISQNRKWIKKMLTQKK